MVDHDARIHDRRGHAAELLEAADGLLEERGRLTAWRPSCDGRLLATIDAACGQPTLRPLVLTIERPSGRAAYQLVIRPCAGRPGLATVLVTDRNPEFHSVTIFSTGHRPRMR